MRSVMRLRRVYWFFYDKLVKEFNNMKKNAEKKKRQARLRRHKRVRARVFGTAEVPRLCVYRSNKGMFVQLIDDQAGRTLVSANNKEVKVDGGSKTEVAREIGKLIAKKALEKNISKVVFDRGGYKYHGRVRAVAEGARENGLNF